MSSFRVSPPRNTLMSAFLLSYFLYFSSRNPTEKLHSQCRQLPVYLHNSRNPVPFNVKVERTTAGFSANLTRYDCNRREK